MNVFTDHPHAQGVTYFEHWGFAIGIAWRLFCSVFAFVIHALIPEVTIKRRFDLEATAAFLLERNTFIETAAATGLENRRHARHDTPAHA